jgi:hypothetical protein
MKNINSWDVTLCSPLKVNRRFGRIYRLHLQGRRMCRVRYTAWKQVESRAVRIPSPTAFWTFYYFASLVCKVDELHSDYAQWVPIHLHTPEIAACIPMWELFCFRVLGTVIIFIQHNWLRHATNQKVVGSIPDVTVKLPNPSSRTMDLWSTQPLREMCTRNILGGKGRLELKYDNLTAIFEPIFYKIWEPRRVTTLWASPVWYKNIFTFLFQLWRW